MPKMKTSRAAAKRFKKTGTGLLKRNKAYKSHILTKKSQKRKRNLRKSTQYLLLDKEVGHRYSPAWYRDSCI